MKYGRKNPILEKPKYIFLIGFGQCLQLYPDVGYLNKLARQTLCRLSHFVVEKD